MPTKINKEIINNINSLEVLDQKIKELETSLTSLKEDQNDLKSKIKPYKDNSISCITKDGTRELTGDWDIGDDRKILADEIKARNSAGLKLLDDAEHGIFIEDGGQVGIETTTPSAPLHVSGAGKLIVVGNSEYNDKWLKFRDSAYGVDFGFSSNVTLIGGTTSGALLVRAGAGKGFAVACSDSNTFNNVTSPDFVINDLGYVGILTIRPTSKLDINSDLLRLRTAKTPASAGASGNQGDFCWDANFIYICTATNTWKRIAIATW